MTIHKALCAITKDLSSAGIGKGQTNKFDGYKFRGIDDVYNALGPLLAKHGVVIRVAKVKRHAESRQASGGKLQMHVTVKVRYELICADDGSSIMIVFPGEGMDRSDKATAKAMSAAYKYMVLETFCIPTEGQTDADAETPVAETPVAEAPTQKTPDQLFQQMMAAIGGVRTINGLNKLAKRINANKGNLEPKALGEVIHALNETRSALESAAAAETEASDTAPVVEAG